MIDIEKMVSTLSIPDGMSVDEMRSVVVDVLDMAKASNEDEKALTDENEIVIDGVVILGSYNIWIETNLVD